MAVIKHITTKVTCGRKGLSGLTAPEGYKFITAGRHDNKPQVWLQEQDAQSAHPHPQAQSRESKLEEGGTLTLQAQPAVMYLPPARLD